MSFVLTTELCLRLHPAPKSTMLKMQYCEYANLACPIPDLIVARTVDHCKDLQQIMPGCRLPGP